MTDRTNEIRAMRVFYTLLSLTWGLPLTLAGILTFAVLILGGKRTKRFGFCYYIEVGERWGGLEFGLFFLTCKNPTLALRLHEHGHGLQNLFWGPLMLPVITIPSAIRWHWRRHLLRRDPARMLPLYSAIWFEGQADAFGRWLYDRFPKIFEERTR